MIDSATPDHISCSLFCMTIQAPIITSIVVSMSAPRRRLSRSNSMAPPMMRAEQHRKCKRSKEIDAKKHHQRIHAVGAECVKFTVREIDHTHDAEYESEPDPQQRISAAEDRRIQEMLK